MAFAGYASPRDVPRLEDCFFYHTMELPTYGLVRGLWDLRPGIDDYLGHVSFSGKRVLEFGPANGYITFHMESQGASVVGCELSADHAWDVVPYAGISIEKELAKRREHLRQLNNAFWLSHHLLNSKANVIYSRVYDLPDDAGPFDIAVYGSILLHLRDPFLALQRGISLTREMVVVTT